MWFPTLVPKAEPQDGYEWVETRPLQENVRQTPPDAERLAEALRNARGFVRHFGDEPARVCIAEIDAALAAHSAQAQPPANTERLAELLRGLEIGPMAATLSPKKLFAIGAAIAAQAKEAQPPAARVPDWTDAQCVAFMAVGLRHTEYKKGKSPTVEEIRQGAKAALAAQENLNG